VLDPLVTRHLIEHLSMPSATGAGVSRLTAKEQRILEGIASGLLNKEIAATLSLSEKTVRNQLTAIYEKLGVKTRAEAAILFERMRSTE
jgi:DNA-binding NarL/FixJ family response regulator